jgi:hypothetical protein
MQQQNTTKREDIENWREITTFGAYICSNKTPQSVRILKIGER